MTLDRERLRMRYKGYFRAFATTVLGHELAQVAPDSRTVRLRADVTRKSQIESNSSRFSAQMTETALGGDGPPAARVLALDVPRTTAAADIYYTIFWNPELFRNRIVSFVNEADLVRVLTTAGIQHLVRHCQSAAAVVLRLLLLLTDDPGRFCSTSRTARGSAARGRPKRCRPPSPAGSRASSS